MTMYRITKVDLLFNQTLMNSSNTSEDGLIHILDFKSMLRPDILTISKPFQWLICGICWIVIVIGSYFRHILYKYLFDQYKQKESRPIDILTLVLTTSHHLAIVLHAILLTLMVLMDTNVNDIAGNWSCVISKAIVVFDLSYSDIGIGSLGIAIYRLFYIKFQRFSANVREMKTCYIILIGGLAISVVNVVLVFTNDYQRTADDNCMLVPKRLLLETLDEYEISRGNPSIYPNWQNVREILGFKGLCMNAAELIIYIDIFYFIYKHDNSELLRRLLDPSVTRRRNKTNAITFFGQFCSFVVKVSIVIFFIISTKVQALYMVFVLKYAGFAAMSMVEVFTSNVLRSRFFNV